ncbi:MULTISPECIES: AzlC family ABC transporter permease [Actinoalloteichus]|uniref:Branched-chain amino acid permease (Azaleucine resistance) n=1 Tax=Actinoalloteichus fjordicus TaxID=1612552 RepID=A0AAC9LA86_9PSEU|nr:MULTISPECIES: AzlC family ABC transporter permease [Actinoalloteichus]APU14223.1 putative branched-chain amino acid permease (azaleucine resistance) [Actinoalloteichus fjordicus]APU20192.1 putative branched-chain amino acid permease (azaleucine resistance) [Actinoalloteichus sp. GBA129-24]
MSSIWRTIDRPLLRDVGALAAAIAVVGASFGAMAVAAGLSMWTALFMSLVVFAGGAQFMVVGVLAAGGGPVAAVVAGLLLNLRHLPFGLALGDTMGRGLLAKLVGSHVLIDESVAFALAQRDPERARAAYWVSGVAAFLAWNPAVVLGALAGEALGDTAVYGVDAAFPAALVALVLPALRVAATRRAALIGALVAVAATPVLPAGMPVLLALIGVVFALPLPRWARQGGNAAAADRLGSPTDGPVPDLSTGAGAAPAPPGPVAHPDGFGEPAAATEHPRTATEHSRTATERRADTEEETPCP